MDEMIMKAYTVNIGVNTGSDPIRRSGPIYPNGSFDYVPIPHEGATETYDEIGLSSAFRRMNIEDKLYHETHHDPEFIGYTYGNYPEKKPYVAPLKQIENGDLLVFLGSLERTPHEMMGDEFPSWIVDPRGMYLLGFLEVIGILTHEGELFDDELGLESYATSVHYYYYDADPGNTSWIFKGSTKSCLFPVAVPLGRKEFEKLFDKRLPRKTKQSETAQVSSYTRTARQVANIPFLRKLISNYCPSVWQ